MNPCPDCGTPRDYTDFDGWTCPRCSQAGDHWTW